MASILGKSGATPLPTLTREEMNDVKKALAVSIDEVIAYSDKSYTDVLVLFITRTIIQYKLTYLLTPAALGELLKDCFELEPFKSFVEEMSVRFYLNISSADYVWERLVNTLSVACSFHNPEDTGRLLPESFVSNTVPFDEAKKVFSSENWLVFIAAMIAYHEISPSSVHKEV